MDIRPTITPEEMKEYREFFPRLLHPRFLSFVSGMLGRLGRVIGYPVLVFLPEDVLEYKGDQESLRALRILGKLRNAGIVKMFYTNVHQYADEPRTYVTLADLHSTSRTGMSGKSPHMTNKAATLWPALGEAVERQCVERPYIKKNEYIDSSWEDLSGPKADIFDIAGFDERQRAAGHPDYKFAYSKDTVFRWVSADELTYGQKKWAPLQWFSFAQVQKNANLHSTGDMAQKEPIFSATITTGAAAAQEKEAAILHGLLEIIERDAFIIYWLNQIVADRIDPHSFKEERFEGLLDVIQDYRFEAHLLYLKTDLPIHTVCAVLIDRTGVGPALMIDAKTDYNLSDAVYGALHSILSQRGQFRRMMEDRDKSIPLPKNVTEIDHAGRMHIWFQKEQLSEIEHFISGGEKSADTFPTYEYSGNVADDLQKLLQVFREKEYEVFCRELISPELKQMTEGLSVVMVKVPKMQPLYLEESLRSIGGERLREIPKLLGYSVDESKEDPFCTVPHPFP